MNGTKFALLIIIFCCVTSCGYRPAGLAPSTTPVDMKEVTVLGHATGEVSYFSLLGIFPFGKPDYQVAIQDALSKFENGKALINVRSTFKTTWVVVGVIQKLTIEGDVVR